MQKRQEIKFWLSIQIQTGVENRAKVALKEKHDRPWTVVGINQGHRHRLLADVIQRQHIWLIQL